MPMLQWHRCGVFKWKSTWWLMLCQDVVVLIQLQTPSNASFIGFLLPNVSNLRSAQWFSRLFTIIRRVTFRNLLFRLRPSLDESDLRSSSQQVLLMPRHRTHFSEKAFAVAGQTMWNLLPMEVRNAPTLMTFRHRLKEHFFRTAYQQWCKAPSRRPSS